jgi:DNA-binding response OmpR family regulator
VVDDEPDVVLLMERALRAEGFDVLTAYDGISAVDIAARELPDLVLLDVMMPMMSGYEVCSQLKATPETSEIPVLCITSAHTGEARARSREAGAAGLIPKPFLPEELVAQVRRYLRKPAEQE